MVFLLNDSNNSELLVRMSSPQCYTVVSTISTILRKSKLKI